MYLFYTITNIVFKAKNNSHFFHIGFPKTASTFVHQVIKNSEFIDCLESKDLNTFSWNKVNFNKKKYLKSYKKNNLPIKVEVDHSLIEDFEGLKLLKDNFPHSKLIVVTRNPFDYIKSNFLYQISQGKYLFSTSEFSKFFKNENHELFQSERLEELFALFDRSQILLLEYEELKNEKKLFFNKLENFFEIKKDSFEDIGIVNPARIGRYPKNVMFFLRKINLIFRKYTPRIHTILKNNHLIQRMIFKQIQKKNYDYLKIIDKKIMELIKKEEHALKNLIQKN